MRLPPSGFRLPVCWPAPSGRASALGPTRPGGRPGRHARGGASRLVAMLATGAAVVVLGCGSYDAPPTAPTPPAGGGEGGTPPPSSATITIGAGGVSPAAVTIARGGRVTVINNNNRVHEIASDPHPNHTDCPEINLLGTLAPGQSGMTGVLNVARQCGFHDHLDPDATGLRGSITVQ
jgi:hypothetical protein